MHTGTHTQKQTAHDTKENMRKPHNKIDLETIHHLHWVNNSSLQMCWEQIVINSLDKNQWGLKFLPDVCVCCGGKGHKYLCILIV